MRLRQTQRQWQVILFHRVILALLQLQPIFLHFGIQRCNEIGCRNTQQAFPCRVQLRLVALRSFWQRLINGRLGGQSTIHAIILILAVLEHHDSLSRRGVWSWGPIHHMLGSFLQQLAHTNCAGSIQGGLHGS